MFREQIAAVLQKLIDRTGGSDSELTTILTEFSTALISEFDVILVRLHNLESKMVARDRDAKVQHDEVIARIHNLSNFMVGVEGKLDELAELIMLTVDMDKLTPDDKPKR